MLLQDNADVLIMFKVIISALITFTLCYASADENAACEEPPPIEGTVLLTKLKDIYEVGSTVEYDCEFGYLPSQHQKTITCQILEETGSLGWTEPEFTCIPRSCGDPGYVSHARRNGSVFTFPSRITYVCDVGYKLVGLSQRFCQTNGQWSGSLPTCKSVMCPVPDDVENGSVVYEDLSYGSELKHTCKKGFSLSGSGRRLCSENGTWNGTAPQCLENQCPYPEAPLHGSRDLVGGKTDAGNIVIYSCDKGYKLFGSPTSKCLSTGDWTFPTPICHQPCKVPDIANGHIGFYKGRGRSKKFEKLTKGSNVEDDAVLYLKCSDKRYEAAGQALTEVQISCINGQWTHEPICKPAACRSAPPSVPNARLTTTGREHGTSLVYLCNSDYFKTEHGSTSCTYGVWKGKLPICADIRCSLSNLDFEGLAKKGKEKYSNREYLEPECLEGYELSKPANSKLTCDSGKWTGNLPPCKPAKCSQPPPAPRNGHVVKYSFDHGSIATVACNRHFQLSRDGIPVQCYFGQWKMSEDVVCKDTQCYLKDFDSNSDGVDLSDSLPTASGREMKVKCLNGFEKMHKTPLCQNGKWKMENNYSPCQPSPCVVSEILHGELKYMSTSREISWRGYHQVVEYKKEVIGVRRSHGSEIFLACTSPYIFNGQDDKLLITVQCKYGKWDPPPLCLRSGYSTSEDQVSSSTTELTSSSSVREKSRSLPAENGYEVLVTKPVTPSTTTIRHDHSKLDAKPETSSFSSEDTFLESSPKQPEENCSCIYNLRDEDLVAYSESERLEYGSKVKLGSIVNFFCYNIGNYRLMGISELKCENCDWHSTIFPYCVRPSPGDAIIKVETKNNNAVLVGRSGVVILPRGISANITCTAINSTVWPGFDNMHLNINPVYHSFYNGKGYDLVTKIIISQTSSIYDGRYMCKTPNGYGNYLDIAVQAPSCPELNLDDSVVVSYSNENNPNSHAKFHCIDESMILNGDSEITCLPSGIWSSDTPVCQYVECITFEPRKNLIVTYKGEKRVNSLAEFICLEPYVLKGNTNASCLPNGLWSAQMPTCEYVVCSLHSLMSVLSEDVVPREEDVTGADIPHGAVLQLECSQSTFKVIGTKNVTCGKTGEWLVGDVVCVPGCDSVRKSETENLIVDPNKEFYRFGEYITLSCPPGLSLNLEIERMMCLGDGWSTEDLPVCE